MSSPLHCVPRQTGSQTINTRTPVVAGRKMCTLGQPSRHPHPSARDKASAAARAIIHLVGHFVSCRHQRRLPSPPNNTMITTGGL